MSKILAVDYGQKRVGLAITDDHQLIASGLTTIHSKDIFEYLNSIFSKENISIVVVGVAKNLDNTPSQSRPTTIGCRDMDAVILATIS